MMSAHTNYEAGTAESFFSESDIGDANSIAASPQQQPLMPDSLTKRAIDILLAIVLFVVFSPFMLFCVLALSLSNGQVIFSQLRVGKGGRMFRVYKFRTMIPDAQQALEQLLTAYPLLREEYLRDHKLKNDPRVTRLGRFLRRTSLDELPQLWNVLIGEMSLVGPRPVEYFEIRRYGRFARYYYAQKPGLTGLWQTSGRNNISYRRRVAMDAHYSRKRSLWMDIFIIANTVKVVLLGRGAY